MRIGIDLDGVLANFNRRFLDILNMQTGRNEVLRGDPQSFAWAQEQFGFTDEQVDHAWEYINETKGLFWNTLAPFHGTVDALRRLRRLAWRKEVDVYFITFRSGQGVKEATEEWLDAMGFRNPTVILAAWGTKGVIAAALQLNVLVDDLPDVLHSVWNIGAPTRTYLVKRDYNKRLWADPRVNAVDSIGEMLDIEFGKEQETKEGGH